MSYKLLTICLGEINANLIKGRLENESISVKVDFNTLAGGMYPTRNRATGEYGIYVEEKDIEKAKALLNI